MDKEFQTNIDTTITERHGYIISQFRKDNHTHRKLNEHINRTIDNIEKSVSEDIAPTVKKLIQLMTFKSHIEGRYMYVQGFKDSIALYSFFDSEYLTADFSDLFVYDECDEADTAEGGGNT